MKRKPTYLELEERIRKLESGLVECGEREIEPAPEPISLNFKRLADRSQDAIYHFDLRSNRFIYINKRFIELYGPDVENLQELTLDSLYRHIQPEDRAKVRKNMADSVAAANEGGEVEYRITTGVGAVRWMHDRWIVIRDENKQAIAVEGFIRDTTDRKMADVELEASRKKALIGSYIVQGGKFRYVNPEFTRITQYNYDELIGTDSFNLVHEDYKEYVRKNAVQMLKGERTAPYEFCVINKSGEIKWIMETVSTIQFRGQRASIGYFMDITRLRQLQHNLSSLGLMIGAVSHSLKGCLTGLDAGLYLIDTGFYRDKPARIEEGLDTAKLMVDRLRKLVFDVLYYAKDRDLEPQTVDVLQFANDVAANVETRIRGANITFAPRYHPDLGQFEIDTERILTALVNILENAMEACIEDYTKMEHRIEFIVRPEGEDGIIFEITDNGPGMEQEELDNAFRLFYSSKGKKGTGLGLFITRNVVQQHGGSVTAVSEPGGGARFQVRLPKNASTLIR